MGSNEERKKERELLAVREVLARALGLSRDVPLRSHESPDVIATLPDIGEVGIEVVEPSDPGTAAGMAGLARMEAHVRTGLAAVQHNVEMHVRTRDGFIPALNDGETGRRHVRGLLALAGAHIAAGRKRRTYRPADLRPYGLDRLASVALRPANTPTVYTGASVIGNGVLLVEAVQRAIDQKNAKVDAYRAELGTRPLWLLVLAGGSFASGTASEIVRDGEYTSRFDRTLYIDAYDGAAFDLITRSGVRSG